MNPAINSVSIPAIQTEWTEICGETLSTLAFNANFADCESFNYYGNQAENFHMDILSTINGALRGRIPDPSALVNGQKVFHHLYAFGDNTASHIRYAVEMARLLSTISAEDDVALSGRFHIASLTPSSLS